MMVSVDVHRPAAILQLGTLAGEIGALFHESRADEDPVNIATRALDAAKRLAVRLLERDDSRAALADAFADAAHRALDDDDVRDHASRAVQDALSDRKVQKTAGDALWNAYKYSIGLGPRRINTPPVADDAKLASKAEKDSPADLPPDVVAKEDPPRNAAPSLELDTVPTPTPDDAQPQQPPTEDADGAASSSLAATTPPSTSSSSS